MDRRPLNAERPDRVPVGRMGDIPVIARFVFEDGEEWRPVSANRWTSTHVMVTWVEEGPNRDHAVWLRAEDVARDLRKDKDPASTGETGSRSSDGR